MIVLIGGSGCAGKTNLAHQLMIDNQMPYFSVDYLMMGLFRSDEHCGFDPESDNDLIREKLWPIVLEMIKTSIENCHSMVFEGFQISPKEILKIESRYSSHIIPVFLLLSEDYIRRSHDIIKKNRGAIESREDTDEIETMIMKNRILATECTDSGITPYFIKDNYVRELALIKNDINQKLALNRDATR